MNRTSLALILLFVFPLLLHAQNLPVIDFFTVDTPVLDYSSVERGTAAANFSWQASGLRSGDRMQMHAWVNGDWRLIGENFEPAKTDSLVIAHPLSFELPRYRLSIVDSSGQRIVESFLELQYAEPTVLPGISYFLSRADTITPETILNDEGVAVHWSIYNRWYRSNIIYEQVLPDGRVIAIADNVLSEFRRATDQGVLYPEYAGDGQDVVLRLRVVNIDTNETLTQRDTIVPVIPSNHAPAELISFTVSPDLGRRGGTATLSWNVSNAHRVYITQTATGVSGCKFSLPPDEVYRDLPTTGTLEVQIPAEAYGPIRFQIVPDRYIVGAFTCEPSGILEEIFLELENYNSYNPVIREIGLSPSDVARAGDTLSLNWNISEGQSLRITQSSGFSGEAQQSFADLPLAGSLQITIPDTAQVRQDSYISVTAYLVREGVAEPEIIWTDGLTIDPDDNLNCVSYVRTEPPMIATVLPNQDIAIAWDGCGLENLLLQTIMEDHNNNYEVVLDETQAVGTLGSQVITAPNQEGVLRFVLYRVLEGQQIEIQRTSLLVEN
jgi:hypothetical protein